MADCYYEKILKEACNQLLTAVISDHIYINTKYFLNKIIATDALADIYVKYVAFKASKNQFLLYYKILILAMAKKIQVLLETTNTFGSLYRGLEGAQYEKGDDDFYDRYEV